MVGYSWISITALGCYLFLLLTFLSSRNREREIRAFMILMLIMIMWAGGSFAMRMQWWPAVNFWHHVSVLGMMMLASGYNMFVLDFLEEKNNHGKVLWMVCHFGLFIFNVITGLFVPNPLVVTVNGETQFIYNYTWHIYVLLLCLVPCLVQLALVMHRHCKGNRLALQRLGPVITGLAIMVLGHVAATLPSFAGFPLDIISGVVNVLFVFYALYKKRLFKISLLLSKVNYIFISVVVGGLIAYRLAVPLQHFLASIMKPELVLVAVAAVMILVVAATYGIITLTLNSIFVRKERQQQNRIQQLSEEINHMLSVSDILQNMTDVILATTRVERMIVFIQQTDGDYRVEHTTNPLDEKGYYLLKDHPLVNYLKKYDCSVNLRDFKRSTFYRSLWEKEKRLLETLKADCFVPLLSEEHLVGMIVLPQLKDHASYRENDLHTVRTIAAICARAVREAYVYERAIDEARTDKLTGLINRKYFMELLEREFQQYKDTALSLCLLNLDDFKLYNQLYGTQEGDLALSRVASVLRSTLNETCHAARIGAKEFALILPGYDIYSAKLLTENLVSEIREINSRSGGHISRKLTVSAGICAVPYMASSTDELFQNAETAVYTVKRSGKNAVQIYSADIYLQEEQQNQYRSGYGEHAGTIYALTAAIDTRDHYTFRHSQNVAYYASELAKAAGMEKDLQEIARESGLLHDIGKIGIREDVLNKPGALTKDEFESMKGHVENAVNIIRNLPSLDYVIPAVYSHHERYDGNGYPRKLAGEDIPIIGRILCIADSFDAMTSVRSYKEAYDTEKSLGIIEKESGKQFDPKLAMIFIEAVRSGKIELRNRQVGNGTADVPAAPAAPAEVPPTGDHN